MLTAALSAIAYAIFFGNIVMGEKNSMILYWHGAQASYRIAAKWVSFRRQALIASLAVFGFLVMQPVQAQNHSSWDEGDGQRQIDIGRYVLTSTGDGRWLVTDRQTGDTRVVREQRTGSTDHGWGDRSRDNERSRFSLGRVWREQESGWSGLWRRRGDTNVFDAVWTGPGRVTATLEIRFEGNDGIKIERRNSSDGVNCHYSGRISDGPSHGRRMISGTYRCGNGGIIPWSATIED